MVVGAWMLPAAGFVCNLDYMQAKDLYYKYMYYCAVGVEYSSFCHFQKIEKSSGDYPVVSSFHFDIDVICGLISLCFRGNYFLVSYSRCVFLVYILKVGFGLIRISCSSMGGEVLVVCYCYMEGNWTIQCNVSYDQPSYIYFLVWRVP